MLPSIISGLWGMNVPVPFGSHPFGFAFVSDLTAILIIGTVYLFFKKKWI
jgi:magnesium transporter